MGRFFFGVMMLPVIAVVAGSSVTRRVRRTPIRWHVQPTGTVESLLARAKDGPRNIPAVFPRVIHQVIFNLNYSFLESEGSYGWLNSTSGKELKVPRIIYENTVHISMTHPGWEIRTYDWESMLDWVKKNEEALNKLMNEWPSKQKEKLNWLFAADATISSIFHSLSAWYGALVSDVFRYLVITIDGGVYMDCKGGLGAGTFEDLIQQYPDFDESLLLLTYSTTKTISYKWPKEKTDVKFDEWKDKYGILGLRDVWLEKDGKKVNELVEIAQFYFASTPGHPLLKILVRNVLNSIMDYILREYYVYGVTYNENVDNVLSGHTITEEPKRIVVRENVKASNKRWEKFCNEAKKKGEGLQNCDVHKPNWEDLGISEIEGVPRVGQLAVFGLTGPSVFGSTIYFGIAELVSKAPDVPINVVVATAHTDQRRCKIEAVSCRGKVKIIYDYYSSFIRQLEIGQEHRIQTTDYWGKNKLNLKRAKKFRTYEDVSYWTIGVMLYQTRYDNLKSPVAFWDPQVACKVRDGMKVTDKVEKQ